MLKRTVVKRILPGIWNGGFPTYLQAHGNPVHFLNSAPRAPDLGLPPLAGCRLSIHMELPKTLCPETC